jgi:hypothetical protein
VRCHQGYADADFEKAGDKVARISEEEAEAALEEEEYD